MQSVDGKAIVDILSTARCEIKFVFVSACHSEEAGVAFAKAGVKHVVNITFPFPFLPFLLFSRDHFCLTC